ncbi:MAG TPA: retropepsin-like aspartic protease [Candidatus Binatia bacterium]|nr:retropepsin-like aspartic protease [Candidatus Binatia bacterium]
MRTPALLPLCFWLGLIAAAPVTLASGSNATRATIPVTIGDARATCVLDTGTSAMLVSPDLAQRARLVVRAGTFELAPDGRTYVDRQTEIPRFGVAGHELRNVPALVSQNLTGPNALCGYDFFAHFPTLIDRDRRSVTLFPEPAKIARMRCTPVDLSPRVPLATVEINDTWLTHVVLDSGMAGGGALWDGVRDQLRSPLIAASEYETMPAAARSGFSCGATASVRYAQGSPASSMPVCTEPQRPDGYNGIIETNLSSVRAMAVDYPHSRICFDVAEAPRNAWSRFDALRAPRP